MRDTVQILQDCETETFEPHRLWAGYAKSHSYRLVCDIMNHVNEALNTGFHLGTNSSHSCSITACLKYNADITSHY